MVHPAPQCYSMADIAALLGKSYDWFSRQKDRLTRDSNFPAPLPVPGSPRWNARAVDQWIETGGQSVAPVSAPPQPEPARAPSRSRLEALL